MFASTYVDYICLAVARALAILYVPVRVETSVHIIDLLPCLIAAKDIVRTARHAHDQKIPTPIAKMFSFLQGMKTLDQLTIH
jgi:hypothetical protein